MVLKSKIIIILLTILSPGFVICQDDFNKKAQAINAIVQFVEWPKNCELDKTQNFTISVFNNPELFQTLHSFFQDKFIKNKKVIVNHILHTNQIKNCNLLFISKASNNELKEISEIVKKKPILTITNTSKYLDNGIQISIYFENETTKRIINQKAVIESGLIFRYYLYENAKILNSN